MAIAFGTIGAVAVGTNSLSVAYPASIAAGDMLVLLVSNKAPTSDEFPVDPSGWTRCLQNFATLGSDGTADQGQVLGSLYYKQATGSESGSLSVTFTGTNQNSAAGVMARYTKSSGAYWIAASDSSTADGSGGSISASSESGNLAVSSGDMVIGGYGINTDNYTYGTHAFAETSVTFAAASERADSGTTNGTDCGLLLVDALATAGTGNAALTFTSTPSGSVASAPALSGALLRLREGTGIVYVDAGAGASGSTSLSLPYPTGIIAGDLLVVAIANKYPANGPTTPSGDGFSFPTNGQGTGGAGAAGNDAGSTYATVYTKVADGTETGNLSVTLTSANSSRGRMFLYRASPTNTWSVAAANGGDNTAGTSISVTCGTDPGFLAGDMAIAVFASNTDARTHASQAIAATGISAWGTVAERDDAAGATGQDVRLVVSEHPVTAGTSSAAPVYTCTASGTTADQNAGGGVILRLRSASSGVVGSASLTLDAVTTTATGVLPLTGTSAITLADATTASTGVLPIVASAAITLGDTTTTATGAGASISGDASITLADVTGAGTGVLPLVASATPTLDGATTTATGTLPILGAAAVQLADVTVSGAGVLPIVGAASVTLGGVTTAGTGALALSGTAAITLDGVTSAGTGVLPLTGAASSQLGDATTAGAAVLPIVASASLTLDAVTVTAEGTSVVGALGEAVITLAAVAGASTGVLPIVAASALTLAGVTSSGAGAVALSGAASVQLADVTGAGTGALAVHGAASVTLDGATAAGTGALPIAGAASGTLAGATAAGTGVLPLAGSASGTLDGVTVTADGVRRLYGAATIVLGDVTATGDGAQVVPGSGAAAITLAGVTVTATGVRPTASLPVYIASMAVALTSYDAGVAAKVTRYAARVTEATSYTTETIPMLDIGDTADLPLLVKRGSDGALVDPDALTLTVLSPAGAVSVYTFGTDLEVERISEGAFRGLVPCTVDGTWTARWLGTGDNAGASADFTYVVRARAF